MSLLGKPIEEVIETLYNSIKNKRQIINNIKKEYNINNDNLKEIKINRLKLIDLLDEFEVTISQSLQAIQTLKVEIFNIKEKQATEEILNLTNELQMKYNITESNSNINDKLEYNKKNNSNIEPNINQKNNIDNIQIINSKNANFINNNNFINKNDDFINQNNNSKEMNSLTDAKLNFDYSGLLNNSDLSLKNSLSNLDKYRIDYNQNINDNIKYNKLENNINDKEELILNMEKEFKRNRKLNEKKLFNEKKEEKNIINNNSIKDISNILEINEQEIIEDQPSKLNINITPSNNDILNNINFSANKSLRNDISYLSETNSNNIIRYNNKYNSSRKIESNHNKIYNFNFNNLPNINYLNNKDNNSKKINGEEKGKIINKSNDDIKYSNQKNINNDININKENEIGIEDYSIKGDSQNNIDESDIISIVSKKDILLEKIKKIEEEEKMRKLIEEVFSVKSFKLYILDKFGKGKYDTFIKRYKKGEIKKEELETELNILKELSLKNSNSNKNNFQKIQKKAINKNNYNNNYSFNNGINDNQLHNTNKYYTENNSYIVNSNSKYKKINERNKSNMSNRKAKEINKGEVNRPFNFKNSLREGNRISNNISNSSFSNVNTNKNISSHSVSSIRARLKRKKF